MDGVGADGHRSGSRVAVTGSTARSHRRIPWHRRRDPHRGAIDSSRPRIAAALDLDRRMRGRSPATDRRPSPTGPPHPSRSAGVLRRLDAAGPRSDGHLWHPAARGLAAHPLAGHAGHVGHPAPADPAAVGCAGVGDRAHADRALPRTGAHCARRLADPDHRGPAEDRCCGSRRSRGSCARDCAARASRRATTTSSPRACTPTPTPNSWSASLPPVVRGRHSPAPCPLPALQDSKKGSPTC